LPIDKRCLSESFGAGGRGSERWVWAILDSTIVSEPARSLARNTGNASPLGASSGNRPNVVDDFGVMHLHSTRHEMIHVLLLPGAFFAKVATKATFIF